MIIDNLPMAAGIAFHKGTLFVGTTTSRSCATTTSRTSSTSPASPRSSPTSCPAATDHSWKYLRIQDDKLYYNIGAPCNICDPGEYAKIYRMNLDGSNVETVAAGVRNTVGFDFDPKTGNLWFTDNGRDWLSEEIPNDELNVVTGPEPALRLSVLPPGQHP